MFFFFCKQKTAYEMRISDWRSDVCSSDLDGRITGLRAHVLADHGAFDACADPTKWPAGFFNICTGSYDIPTAHVAVDGVYTNKAPGGVAYRCSFRVTEAAYVIERAIDILAKKLGMDPVELRLKNFIQPHQFPYQSALGWEYDSGDYPTAMKKAIDATSYAALDRKSVVKGKSVSVRVDLGGRRIIKKK